MTDCGIRLANKINAERLIDQLANSESSAPNWDQSSSPALRLEG
jgi:hypothetical protein